ncbi:hypothetical protein FAES_0698 [Fibrella aestuarina BUZ 2]|uniref:DUF2157 domain-containing protein n=1 Tax=Fibrella aestuarina BUZ 2 TaxID=1166018 RepID=I0K3K6_9BACT|nr:hypothetical protein [Fibrella aestuarina]CCG98709.1 hypothetical protein FAES_0698 [Fibrella aestuarina BUZ 2]
MLYDPDHIDEREILRQVDRWKAQQLVTPEQIAAIQQAFPKRFRQTNPWLEIGAFLFAILAVLSLYGLFMIQFEAFSVSGSVVFATLSIGYAVAIVWFARYFVQKNQICRNGTDNALLVAAAGIGSWGLIELVASGYGGQYPPFWMCALLSLPVLLALIWYSGDVMLSYLALGLFYGLIFDRLLDFSWGQSAMPFALMGISGLLFALVRKEPRRAYYAEALGVVRWLSLGVLLAAGNYFVVRELNALLLDRRAPVSPQIALPGLFWLFTLGLPATYLTIGIRQRNRMLLILGTLGVAAAVATFQHYYISWPRSVVLAIDGTLLIGVAVLLIRYLRQPRQGFTDEPDDEPPHALVKHIGTIASVQATANAQNQPHLRFGGGDFSGSGAGERY